MVTKFRMMLVQKDARKSSSEFINGSKCPLRPDSSCNWILHLLHDTKRILINWLLNQLIKNTLLHGTRWFVAVSKNARNWARVL
jgi:hypothetical protein